MFICTVFNKLDSMLTCIFSDSNIIQMTLNCGKNNKGASGPHVGVSLMFLPHFKVICDLLQNGCMALWNLFFATLYKMWRKCNDVIFSSVL